MEQKLKKNPQLQQLHTELKNNRNVKEAPNREQIITLFESIQDPAYAKEVQYAFVNQGLINSTLGLKWFERLKELEGSVNPEVMHYAIYALCFADDLDSPRQSFIFEAVLQGKTRLAARMIEFASKDKVLRGSDDFTDYLSFIAQQEDMDDMRFAYEVSVINVIEEANARKLLATDPFQYEKK